MTAVSITVKRLARDVKELLLREGREQALRHAMTAIEPLLESPSDELRLALHAKVFAQIKGAQYQASDFETVDYAQFELSKSLPLFRGPKPSDEALAKGEYFCVMGAAQTFGRLVGQPWPILLSKAIGLPVLNLSHGGAGPEFFLNRELAALAQGARFVMLQVLSGRSIGCPDYPGGRNTKIDARKINRLQVLETLWREDPGKALEYVQRWNTAYLETYRQLRALIARPAMLLWLSNRAPWDWRRESLLHEPSWGSFPQLVGSEVYIETARLFEKRLKFVTDDSPQQPLSRITGKPCPYIGTERGAKVKRLHTEFGYYPSTEAHVALAQRLEPWAKNRTARKTPPGPSPLNGRRGPASASVHPASAGRQTPPE